MAWEHLRFFHSVFAFLLVSPNPPMEGVRTAEGGG